MNGIIYALLASVFWGTNGVLLRVGLRGKDVVSSTMTIMLVVSAITFAFSFRDLHRTTADPVKLVYLFLAGFFSYFVARVITYRSVTEVGSSRAFSATSTRILFSALFGYFLLSEDMGFYTLSGTLLMILGLYTFTTERIDRRELVISTSSGIFYGLASLLIKVGMLESVFVSVFIASLSGFLSLAAFSAATGRLEVSINRYIFLSAMSLAAGNIAYFYSLSTIPLVIAVPLSNLYPIVTTTLAYIFLKSDELVGIRTFIGSVLTVAGASLISVSIS
ncbi:DMT family transporter [Geoglobus ahangari]